MTILSALRERFLFLGGDAVGTREEFHAEALAKTAGWVPGTPELGAGLEARLGIGGVL